MGGEWGGWGSLGAGVPWGRGPVGHRGNLPLPRPTGMGWDRGEPRHGVGHPWVLVGHL